MKIQTFLEHHGIARNPFADEDAQTDPVFKDHCIVSTFHPTWDKVYGDPAEPATAVVFGEKGSGKTAMRLQIAKKLEEFNRQHATQKLYVIHYDDFNPFLDRFRDKLSRGKQRSDRVLAQWRLWDHMDAILSLGVTGMIDRLLEEKQPSRSVDADIQPAMADVFDRHQARDLLLLAACYDQSTSATFEGRWQKLRKRLKYNTIGSWKELAIGIGVSAGALALFLSLWFGGYAEWLKPLWVWLIVYAVIAGAAWALWLNRAFKAWRLARGVVKRMRVGNHETGPLRRVLMHFTGPEISGQPLPNKDRTDDRYELLAKFQGLLAAMNYKGIVVLVDRVDEPHLINGSADLMKALLWPMLDNKFLKHPGLGLKLMLPLELTRFIDREDRDFYQRARLDKQNMIPSFEWTGEALFDVTNARLKACAANGSAPTMRSMFDPALTDRRLIDAFRTLRVPRHLFKFLYRVLVQHCNAYTDSEPKWQISPQTFESTLAVYQKDQDAFDRGMGAG
jgi:hypothetical protein